MPSTQSSGLVEAGRIIDAGMDDFAIARTHTLAKSAFFLDDDDLAPGKRERARHGEPDDARANDQIFDFFHLSIKRPTSRFYALRQTMTSLNSATMPLRR